MGEKSAIWSLLMLLFAGIGAERSSDGRPRQTVKNFDLEEIHFCSAPIRSHQDEEQRRQR